MKACIHSYYMVILLSTTVFCADQKKDPLAELPPILEQICKESWDDDFGPCEQILTLMPSGFEKGIKTAKQEFDKHGCNRSYNRSRLTCSRLELLLQHNSTWKRSNEIKKPIEELGRTHDLFPVTIDAVVKHCQNTIQGKPIEQNPLLDYDPQYARQKELYAQKKRNDQEQGMQSLSIFPQAFYDYCTAHYGECEPLVNALKDRTEPKLQDAIKQVARNFALSPSTVNSIMESVVAQRPMPIIDEKKETSERGALVNLLPEALQDFCKKDIKNGEGKLCPKLLDVTYCLQMRGQGEPYCQDISLAREHVRRIIFEGTPSSPDYSGDACYNFADMLLKNIAVDALQKKKPELFVADVRTLPVKPVDVQIILTPPVKPGVPLVIAEDCPGCDDVKQKSWLPWNRN